MGRHDREVHKKANELIDSGYGKIALARGLGIRLGDAGAKSLRLCKKTGHMRYRPPIRMKIGG